MNEEHVPCLLKPNIKPVTLDTEIEVLRIHLPDLERMLLPLLNEVRKAQGKKPVILPKG